LNTHQEFFQHDTRYSTQFVGHITMDE